MCIALRGDFADGFFSLPATLVANHVFKENKIFSLKSHGFYGNTVKPIGVIDVVV